MLKIEDRNMSIVAISSLSSSIICQITCSPFAVLGIRQQKAIRNYNKGIKINFNQESVISLGKYIIQNDGYKTFWNGLRYSLFQTMISTACMFMSYEAGKKYLSAQGFPLLQISLISSILSTIISTSVGFPLEYWKTLSYSHEGNCQLKNYQLGTNIYSAYLMTIKRNILFFGIYWPTIEQVRHFTKIQLSEYNLSDKQLIFVCNFIAGTVSGIVSGLSTQPFDVIKTRIQVFEEFQDKSLIRNVIKVYKEEGFSSVMAGYKPRIIGIISYSTIMLILYENMLNFVSKQKFNFSLKVLNN